LKKTYKITDEVLLHTDLEDFMKWYLDM
jgi:hypothetical protein